MKIEEAIYDKKALRRNLVLIAVVMALMMATGGAGFMLIVPVVIAAVARNRPDKAFFYLLLMVATLVGNGFFYPKNMVYSISQRLLMLILGGLMIAKLNAGRRIPLLSLFMSMFGYVIFMCISSAFGWCPLISFLKIFLFAVVYVAYMGITKMVCVAKHDVSASVRSAILAFAILFLAGSVLLIPFPGISQLSGEAFAEAQKNGSVITSLFMGMTAHSQALGPLVAMINVILLSDMLFSVKRFDRLYCILLLCCPVLIFKTSSRTGMGTYLLSSLYVVYLMMKARGFGNRWRSKAMSTIMGLFSLAVVAILAMPSSRDGVQEFLLKDQKGKGEVSIDTLTSSRAGLVEFAMYNFKRSPWIGNGFQVSEDMKQRASGFKEILSAPVEKGVWYAAVLEEGGAIGFVIFVIVLFLLIFQTAKYGGYTTSACMAALTLSNFGEFTFFSMSYIGGAGWALVFAGVVLDILRKRSQQKQAQPLQGQLQNGLR